MKVRLQFVCAKILVFCLFAMGVQSAALAQFSPDITNMITSFELLSPPNKTIYHKGEPLDLQGAKLKAEVVVIGELLYDLGSDYQKDLEKLQTQYGLTITGFNSNNFGVQTVVATLGKHQVSFQIEVVKDIEALSIAQKPKKTQYSIGQAFEWNGFALSINYNDGSTRIVEFDANDERTKKRLDTIQNQLGITIGRFDNTSAGNKEISFSIDSISCSLKVDVIRNTGSGVQFNVLAIPTKTLYKKGEPLDLRGLKIEKIYNTSTSEIVEVVDYDQSRNYAKLKLTKNSEEPTYTDVVSADYVFDISGFDSNEVGEQDVRLYSNAQDIGEILVYWRVKVYDPVSLKVKTLPNKTKYKYNEDLDLEGLVLEYTNRNEEKLSIEITSQNKADLSSLGLELSGYDKTKVGHQSLTIKKEEAQCQLEVEVMSSVELVELPSKLRYKLGDTLSLIGTKIIVRSEQITQEYEITEQTKVIFADLLSVSGFDSKTVGTKTLTIKFNTVTIHLEDIALNFEVEVYDEIVSIEVANRPYKATYTTGEEPDLTGGTIKVTYLLDRIETFKMLDLEHSVAGYNKNEPGLQNLRVSFKIDDTTVYVWDWSVDVEQNVAVEDAFVAGCGSGSAFEAWTSGGVLSVKAERAAVLEVLGVNGVLLRRLEVAAGAGVNLDLKPGGYVLRLGDEVKKVVVE